MIPLPQLLPGWARAAASVALMAVAGLAGYRLASEIGAGKVAQAEARRMECEQGRESDRRAAAEAAAALLARAQEAEAGAARRLAQAQAATRHRLEEIRRETSRLAAGRECLSGPLRLRLDAALGHAAGGLSAPAGGADRADAWPAADPGAGEGASADADVAGWILDAAGLYEECRARLDALRQWDEVTHGR